ncbi:eukaryotic translation initiation factor 4E type 3-like [Chelonus insularis]|uniref:eukaryotic translation initiation factor 4E type 3-like n=1 Tax=Chelonus insularis TaxID=460826 RepID=UPI00158BE22A|nr:eukaryotic translation initiation factor 4E type 3-like [Chelonus insularis]
MINKSLVIGRQQRKLQSTLNMATLERNTSDCFSSDLSKTTICNDETITTNEENHEEGNPLESSWTFWLDKAVHGRTVNEYKENLKKIYTVSTIQNFWAVYNNIPKVCEIQNRYNYHLMRDEKLPLWEEEYNKKGGTWRFRCHKTDSELVWKEVVLAAIGEQFNDHISKDDEICGVTVSIRDRDDLIQIWNKNADLIQESTIIQKVQKLVPDIKFLGHFYRSHQSNFAYDRS